MFKEHLAEIVRIGAAAAVTSFMITFGIRALGVGLLGDGAFVSFVGLTLIVCTVILLWNRLSELSLLGSRVKLRDLTNSAEDAIKNLERGRINLYRTILGLKMRFSGGHGRMYLDDRAEGFLDAVEVIRHEGLFADLSPDIYRHTNTLIESIFTKLSVNSEYAPPFDKSGLDPSDLVKVYEGWAASDGRDHLDTGNMPDYVKSINHLKRLLEVNEETKPIKKTPDASPGTVGLIE